MVIPLRLIATSCLVLIVLDGPPASAELHCVEGLCRPMERTPCRSTDDHVPTFGPRSALGAWQRSRGTPYRKLCR